MTTETTAASGLAVASMSNHRAQHGSLSRVGMDIPASMNPSSLLPFPFRLHSGP
jgi:hypothetical protein